MYLIRHKVAHTRKAMSVVTELVHHRAHTLSGTVASSYTRWRARPSSPATSMAMGKARTLPYSAVDGRVHLKEATSGAATTADRTSLPPDETLSSTAETR